MSKELKGTLMVLIAGIAWGLSGVSGQYLMDHGVHVNLLTSLRLLISGILLTGVVLLTQKETLLRAFKQKKVWIGTAFFSLFGLLMNQYAYLTAIHHTNAGTATVLQYLTPVLILVVVSLRNRVLPTVIELLAIGLAIFGTFIIATHGQLTSLAITPVGLFWGLVSAVTYALYILIPAKLIQEWGSLVIIGPAMLMSGLVYPVGIQAWRYDLPLTVGNGLALVGIVY